VEQVEVRVVWSPPWTPEMMSDDAKRYFGIA
jgi:metal-sulfur cluster biosynthetic enzyme